MLLLSCTSKPLTIHLENGEIGEAYLYNTETLSVDTLFVSGNSVSFQYSDLSEPTLFYLMFENINNVSRPNYIILSGQNTSVKFKKLTAVNYNSFNIRDLYPNSPVFIKDPNNNGSFYDFQELFLNFYADIENPNLELADRKRLHSEFIAASGQIIKMNNDKLVSAFIIEYLMINNLIDLEKLQLFFSLLDEEIQSSTIGQKISKEAGFKANTVAPEFALQDYYGDYYSLDNLKGKKVLLHFWSSTCAPCIEEIPTLLEITKTNPDIVIINVSLDTDKERWIEGMKRLGIIEMINYCDFKSTTGKLVSDYHINGIPANYLINEKGEVLAKEQRLENLMDKLN